MEGVARFMKLMDDDGGVGGDDRGISWSLRHRFEAMLGF